MNRLLLNGFIIIFFCLACKDSPKVSVSKHEVTIDQPNNYQYLLEVVSDDIFRVSYVKKGERPKVFGPKEINTQPIQVTQTDSTLRIFTGSASMEININPFSITYFDRDGRKMTRNVTNLFSDDSSLFVFELGEKERIFGGGFHALPLNRRGHELEIYNRPQYGYAWGSKNLNYTLPLWWSSKNYMVFVDNPARSTLDLGYKHTNSLRFSSKTSQNVYYFITGTDSKELIKKYTQLTGRQSLPPRWAFGNIVSRFGYRNRTQTEKVLSDMLHAGFPVDGLVLDIYWFGPELENGQMGRLDWDTLNWPNPEEMITEFKKRNIHTIQITEPFFTRKAKHYPFLSENKYLAKNSAGDTYDIPDFYFGVGGLLDIFNPEAKNWMWQQYKYMRSYGVDGLWVDLAEPEKHPDLMQHANGPAWQVHGLYGHEWASMLWEGYSKDYPTERLFHMGRSGFAGTQRFGIIPWSGDVSRSWEGLQAQLPILLTMASSGLGYMHSDAGGFTMTQKPDAELYIRWLQMAAFSPIFRPHADESVPSEPVYWDINTQKIAKEIIKLRYELLPYTYTLAYENSQTGIPFMRQMSLEFSDSPDTLYDQYMWGPYILVAPVTQAGQTEKKVWLPDGSWYNFYDRILTKGNQWTSVKTEDLSLPIFIRSGGILPMATNLSNAGAFTGDSLHIRYYFDSIDSESQVYFDDGHTTQAWRNNEKELLLIKIACTEESLSLSFKRTGSEYEGRPKSRFITIELIGLPDKWKYADPESFVKNNSLFFSGNVEQEWSIVRKID